MNEEWIRKRWYRYSIERNTAIRKNDIVSFAGKWMERQVIMVNKISMFSLMRNLDL
jgi:hypothetical protein